LAPPLAPGFWLASLLKLVHYQRTGVASRQRRSWCIRSDGLDLVRSVCALAGAAGGPRTAAGRRLSRVTAQPTEDPTDPLVILRDLPEREHEEFLRQYHRAVDAAHDPAGYQHLRRLLHVWSLTAIAAGQPGYYEELAAARAGSATTVPVADAIPDWSERVTVARDRR
jgi:Family of unknown function (DUF6247)